MGIPHLITHLEPYAESEHLASKNVVIDGPAFAYHVYHICMSAKTDARGLFQITPSYAEISKLAIEWLQELEHHGATIKCIYFDGFLPVAKLDVRLSRLVGLSKRMSDYYYTNQMVHLPIGPSLRSVRSLFHYGSVPSRLSALPPAPFLVPAVLEALKDSGKYHDITFAVPGEADLYCSQYLKQNGGVVLTGDSDLLVHDLGESGKVAFFKNLSMSDSEPQVLKCHIYWPAAIAHRLDLSSIDGMISLAFEMKMDAHASFQALVKRAKEIRSDATQIAAFEEFQSDYDGLAGTLPQGVASESALSALQSTDPRISEYLLQFPEIASLAGCQASTAHLSATHIFLPFLIDSPTRTSAWEMSLDVRVLAYSLLNLVVTLEQQKESINEHKKQTDKSKGRELNLLPQEEILTSCDSLLDKIGRMRQRFPKLTSQEQWTCFAILQDVVLASSNSKTSTIKLVRQQMNNGRIGKASSWDVIQLFAQIQASYYSFRMLKQISTFVIAYGNNIPPAVVRLYKILDLPNLSDLQDLSNVSNVMRTIEELKVVDMIYDMLGLTHETLETADKKKAKLAKKKKKRDKTAAAQSRPSSNNPFALLEEE